MIPRSLADIEAADRVSELLNEVADVLISNNWRGDLIERLRDLASSPAAAVSQAPTDLSKRLRDIAQEFGGGGSTTLCTDQVMDAADEIERYYGGMMAWKQTAEKKDRDWQNEVTTSHEAIAGAVARGWCHKSCAHKVMDEQLAYAIVREVEALFVAPADAGIRSAALESAAQLVESFCASDDSDTEEAINTILCQRATRIRALKEAK